VSYIFVSDSLDIEGETQSIEILQKVLLKCYIEIVEKFDFWIYETFFLLVIISSVGSLKFIWHEITNWFLVFGLYSLRIRNIMNGVGSLVPFQTRSKKNEKNWLVKRILL